MAEITTTAGLQTEYLETIGIRRTTSYGLMVEHLDFVINFRRITAAGLMLEYYPRYTGSFVYNHTDNRGIVSGFLEEVVMIAGDEKEFSYTICDKDGITYDLTYAEIYLSFFKYGEPYTPIFTIRGNISNPLSGGVAVSIADTLTQNLSGIYIQQIKLIDQNIKTHIVGQGKVVILKSE